MYCNKTKKVICAICKKQFTQFNFRWHLKNFHPIYNTKSYYDKFIKKHNEGFCNYPECVKKTKFASIIKGYRIGCCNKHAQLSPVIKNKVKKAYIKKYGKYFNNRKKARNTCIRKYGVKNVSQVKKIKNKKAKTIFKNYGVKSPLKSKTILNKVNRTNLKKYGCKWNIVSKNNVEKRRKTFFKKYGTDNIIKSDYFRDKMEKDGIWIPRNIAAKKYKYYRAVSNETKKWLKELFSHWDGKCFYTRKKLITSKNFNKNKNKNSNTLQPTVDHKYSIQSGFLDNIDPKIIGFITNLCICSRSANSKKRANNTIIKVGLDFHGVCDKFSEFFSVTTDLLIKYCCEVHIITGSSITKEFKEKLSNLNIKYTHIFSIVDYHESIGTFITYTDKGPWLDKSLWDRTKADYCKRKNISYHIDDSDIYGKWFKKLRVKTKYLQISHG